MRGGIIVADTKIYDVLIHIAWLLTDNKKELQAIRRELEKLNGGK